MEFNYWNVFSFYFLQNLQLQEASAFDLQDFKDVDIMCGKYISYHRVLMKPSGSTRSFKGILITY